MDLPPVEEAQIVKPAADTAAGLDREGPLRLPPVADLASVNLSSGAPDEAAQSGPTSSPVGPLSISTPESHADGQFGPRASSASLDPGTEAGASTDISGRMSLPVGGLEALALPQTGSLDLDAVSAAVPDSAVPKDYTGPRYLLRDSMNHYEAAQETAEAGGRVVMGPSGPMSVPATPDEINQSYPPDQIPSGFNPQAAYLLDGAAEHHASVVMGTHGPMSVAPGTVPDIGSMSPLAFADMLSGGSIFGYGHSNGGLSTSLSFNIADRYEPFPLGEKLSFDLPELEPGSCSITGPNAFSDFTTSFEGSLPLLPAPSSISFASSGNNSVASSAGFYGGGPVQESTFYSQPVVTTVSVSTTGITPSQIEAMEAQVQPGTPEAAVVARIKDAVIAGKLEEQRFQLSSSAAARKVVEALQATNTAAEMSVSLGAIRGEALTYLTGLNEAQNAMLSGGVVDLDNNEQDRTVS